MIVQLFLVFGILVCDFNKDGFQDILLVGNYYECEVEIICFDVGIGIILMGLVEGDYKVLFVYEIGLYVYLDVWNVLELKNLLQLLVVVVNNNEGVQVYK